MLLWHIFWLFTRVAIFSWGGGPASLALMQRETTAAGWVTPGEFADGVAFGNALPGPIAPQVSAFVGYKIAGVAGAVVAAVGTVIPTTVLMLVIIIFFFGIKDSPAIRAMLGGVRPIIVGLLAWTAYDLGTTVFGTRGSSQVLHTLGQNWDKLLIALAAFLLLTYTKINPVFLVIGGAILGYIVYR